jgi:hypothetical protein
MEGDPPGPSAGELFGRPYDPPGPGGEGSNCGYDPPGPGSEEPPDSGCGDPPGPLLDPSWPSSTLYTPAGRFQALPSPLGESI